MSSWTLCHSGSPCPSPCVVLAGGDLLKLRGRLEPLDPLRAKLKLSFERRFTVSLRCLVRQARRHRSRPRAIFTYFSSRSIPR